MTRRPNAFFDRFRLHLGQRRRCGKSRNALARIDSAFLSVVVLMVTLEMAVSLSRFSERPCAGHARSEKISATP